jgi:catalase
LTPLAFENSRTDRGCKTILWTSRSVLKGVSARAFSKAQYGRFQVHPVTGNQYLSQDEQGAKPANFLFDELTERFVKGPAKFRIVVQIAGPEDEVENSTVVWPAEREVVEFGEFTLSGNNRRRRTRKQKNHFRSNSESEGHRAIRRSVAQP